jgi:hypothetical protein
MDVVRKGVLIGYVTKLHSKIGWSLNKKESETKFGITNSNTRVVGTP